MTAHEAIRKSVDSIITDPKQAAKLSDAVFTALDGGGWFTTDNDHLARMRALLERNSALALDPDTPARDVAALTNRCQALSKDVATLEERVNQERRPANDRNRSAKVSQPLDI